MNDRKLLELAAKAINAIRCEPYRWYGKALDGLWVDFGKGFGKWNPLEDDGDALRLATRLFLTVGDEDKSGVIVRYDHETVIREPYGNDKDAAVRRAIVRAAANIGMLID